MKKIILIAFYILFFGNTSCSQTSSYIKFYTYQGDDLYYKEVDINTGEVKHQKLLTSLGVFNVFQKQDFILVCKYEDTSQESILYRNGDLVEILDFEITEFQLSSVNCDNCTVVDKTDLSKITDNYENTLVLFFPDENSFKEVVLNRERIVNEVDIKEPRYVFYPYYFPQNASDKTWKYSFQIIDLRFKEIIEFDSIIQTNFNERDGNWDFLPNHVFWLSSKEISYLLYKPFENEITIRIMVYDINSKQKRVFVEFKIPNDTININLKYAIKNGVILLSNYDKLYCVKNGSVNPIMNDSGIISGIHF